MAYRKDVLVTGEVYHLYNRGVEKRLIVLDRHDRNRWLATLAYYRFRDVPTAFTLVAKEEPLGTDPLIRIVAYCLMPNHFHLLVEQLQENGIVTFLRKAANSYSRYFNVRHQRVGPLYQGRFQARRIPNTELLLHVSRYIHLNPYVAGLVEDLLAYRWSSYPTYLQGGQSILCDPTMVLQHFPDPQAYARFVLNHADYARRLEAIKHLILE